MNGPAQILIILEIQYEFVWNETYVCIFISIEAEECFRIVVIYNLIYSEVYKCVGRLQKYSFVQILKSISY